MAVLKLDENFRIETDENNFILCYEEESYNEKTDKNYIKKDKWYFPKLSMALDTYLNKSLLPLGDIVSLFMDLQRIESLIKEIKN